MSGDVSRRTLLRAGGGLTLAALTAGCSSPIVSSLTGSPPSTADVIFWHLFGGGDGVNMATMVTDYQKSSGTSVEPTLLSWGNPYYTKLALAASSGRPPDVAVAHLSRLPLLAQAGLLESLDDAGLTDIGVTEDKFTPAAWSKATVEGATYAVPLDTHPFVMFYNLDLARKAGLLASGDELKPISGRDAFVKALEAMKEAGGQYGAISANTADPSTTWRFFLMLYSGLTKDPVVEDAGTRITLDDDAAEETFAFMSELTGKRGLMPKSATSTTVSTLFSQGKVGFLFDGVWQIPTYAGIKNAAGDPLAFNVVPFPAILGDEAVSYADSHALVIPKSDRSATRSKDAAAFVKGLLENSETWAGGGHVPAWLPTQKSAEFAKLKPQSNYVQAAFDAVYDPAGWYTGAGSDFQNVMGGVITGVLGGRTSPKAAVSDMRDGLRTFSTAIPPVS